jgi:hypothetical protein
VENFQIASLYRKELAETPLCLMPECGVGDTPWVFGMQCRSKAERTALRRHLAEQGIETRDYFFPLHLQPAFILQSEAPITRLPHSERISSTGFYLPTHSNLQVDDIRFITSQVRQYFNASIETQGSKNIVPPSLTVDLLKDCNETKKDPSNIDQSIDLLQQAQYCFQGSEIWDDKQALIESIEKRLSSSKSSQNSSTENTLQTYLNYFKATNDIESVPLQKALETTADSFERAICALNRPLQSVLFIGASESHLNQMITAINCVDSAESVNLHAVIYVNKESVHYKTTGKTKTTVLEKNGKPLKIDGLTNVDLLAVDFRCVTMGKLMEVWSDLLELLTSQAILLLSGVDEEHLKFLTENAPNMKIIAKKRQTRLFRM